MSATERQTPPSGASTTSVDWTSPTNSNTKPNTHTHEDDIPLLPLEVVAEVQHRRNDTQPGQSGLIKIIQEAKQVDEHAAGEDKVRLSARPLSREWLKLMLSLGIRVIQIAIIAVVFYIGGKQQAFNLSDDQVMRGIMVSVDAQLAVFGVANKILDYLMDMALDHAVSVTLTLWMACSISDHYAGIKVDDFSIKEELSKPWIAGWAFIQRWRKDGFRFTSLGRGMLCLAVSLAVVLQGAGVNTIGMPKARWSPSYYGGVPDSSQTLILPLMRMLNANVDAIWTQAAAMSADPDPNAIGQIVAALEASMTFTGLSGLRNAMNSDPTKPGWYEVYKSSGSYITSIQVPTNTSQRSIQTVSMQFGGITAIWQSQTIYGNQWARGSTGYTGNLNLTLPFLQTECVPSTNLTATANDTMIAQHPVDMNSSDATIRVLVGASGNFTGANCSVTFRQGLFPVAVWIVDNAAPDASLVNYNNPWWLANDPLNPPTYLFPPTKNDTAFAANLADLFNGIAPNLMGLVQRGPSLTDHMVALSRQFVALNRTAWDSDAAGMTPVIGTLLSQTLTTATWKEEADPEGATVTSAPITWQGYGSSPRLLWEWTIALALGVVLVVAVWDIFLILYYHLSEPPVRDTGGLWLRKPEGIQESKIEETFEKVYYLRETDREVFITVDKQGGKVLKPDVEYTWRH
ncbi:hypothetical protein BGW36DRAFT_423297 [Talaromyces proteolyticus]|uniref:Uncharacterized protein n=1 Tax=Talaromyces proteolyticus TaxID=1131652 RepID=A0AAD4L360_9EURO|nr:uncharacterized protein BGW36DRAFT_423297 [Talaromyces proteolyticus]KAH8703749.1 hypothetical protein BGW36DRAFT_423297 [Talaromyces proteolyticus]